MELSFIVPVMNEVDRIDDCLDNLLPQKCSEIIFVDGGSTDGTLERIKRRKDRRIKVYRETGKVRSPANARNIGVDEAKGDVVYILDVECFLETGFSEKVISEFERNPDSDIIRFRNKPLDRQPSTEIQRIFYHRERSAWRRNPYIYIMKRSVIPRFDPDLAFGEDRVWYNDVVRLSEEMGFHDSEKEVSLFVMGPKNIREVWKRYFWYGRTIPIYYNKTKSRRAFAGMALSFLTIPLLPLALIMTARGAYSSLYSLKEYPRGLILMPVMETLIFPIMCIGIWNYILSNRKTKELSHCV